MECANYPYLQLRAKLIAKDTAQRDTYSSHLLLATSHGAQLRWKGQLGLTQPTLSTSLWEETGVPGENPRLSAERSLTNSFHTTIISRSQRELNPR